MKQYLELMRLVREKGAYKGDRTGTGTYSVFGHQMRFDLSAGKFPLVTTKHTHLKSIIHELLWFLKGETNIRYLKANGVRIWDEWVLKGTEEYRPATLHEVNTRIKAAGLQDEFVEWVKPYWLSEYKEGYEKIQGKTMHVKGGPDIPGSIHWAHPDYDAMAFAWAEERGVSTKTLIAGELGPVYGSQWRSWPDVKVIPNEEVESLEARGYGDLGPIDSNIDDKGYCQHSVMRGTIDQIANLIDMIKKNPDSRRLIVSAWNPAEVDNMALPPCFSAGTLVATPNGYRAIETLQEGEEVISATGIPRRINKVWVTPYSGTMYSLKVRCVGPAIHCTPNHPFFIKDKGWVEAKDIQLGDLMGIPKTKSFRNHSFEVSINHNKGGKIHKRIDLTIDDYYTLGYFMGNGWASVTGNRISFAIPHSKLEEILPRIRKTIKVSKKPGVGENVSTYETKSDTWIPLFREFGHRAHGKKIPQWVMESTKDAKESFLEGFFDADGHFPYFGKVNVTTVSESIAYGVQRLLAEFDLNASVKFQKKKPTHVIEGRTVNQRDLWYLEGHIPLNRSGVVHGEEYLWVPVKGIEEHQTEEIVYNLDVDEEHTYIVQNLATHNCHTMFQFYSNFLNRYELEDVIGKAHLTADYVRFVNDRDCTTDEEVYDAALMFCQEHDLPRRKLSCQLYQRKHHCAF